MEKRIKELARIKQLLNEAESLLEKGDASNAAEKLFEAASESVILLAKKYNLEEAKLAEQKGGWNYDLVLHSAFKLSEILNKEILYDWTFASYLYTLAYLDKVLGVEAVKFRFPKIKRLIELVEKELQ